MPYIYQAELWCDSCGEAICRRLRSCGKAPPAPENEQGYDSDDYPKPVLDCCGDSPDHCAAGEACMEALELPSGRRIGALLSEQLTAEGLRYVEQALQRGGEVAEVWADTFGCSRRTRTHKDLPGKPAQVASAKRGK